MRRSVVLLLLVQSCATVTSQPPSKTTQELAAFKATVMTADYHGDIPQLAQLRDQCSAWPNESVAHYWCGFASWRMAINGVNQGMKSDELATNLKNADTEFCTAIRLREDFPDAYAAAALVNSWLATFYVPSGGAAGAFMTNPDVRERIALSFALLGRAIALDPRNPRVLMARAAFLYFKPGPKGDNVERAMDLYRQMLAEAERRGTDPASPQPDWGKPEALLSLAYVHANETPPDLRAAHDEAEAALRLRSDWSYLRDILLPQIEQRMGK